MKEIWISFGFNSNKTLSSNKGSFLFFFASQTDFILRKEEEIMKIITGLGVLLFGGATGGLIGKAIYDNYKTAKSLKEAEEYVLNKHRAMIDMYKAQEDKIESYRKEMDEWLEELQNKLVNSGMSLEESIELARLAGVPEEKIIHNMEELDKFFLDEES